MFSCVVAGLLVLLPGPVRGDAPDPILGSWKTITDMGGRSAESVMEFSLVDGVLKAIGKSQRGSLEAFDVSYEGGVLRWKINIQQNVIPIEVTVSGDRFEGAAITPLGRFPITGTRISEEALAAADKALRALVGDWTIYTEYGGTQNEAKMRIFVDDEDQDIEAVILMLGSSVSVRQLRLEDGVLRWRVAIPFVSTESALVEAKLAENKFEGVIHSALGEIPIKGELVDTTKLVVAAYDSPEAILGAWDFKATFGSEERAGTVSFAEENSQLRATVELSGESFSAEQVEYKKVSDTMSMARITVRLPQYGEKPLVFELVVNGDSFEGEELYTQGQYFMSGSRRKA
jgi:hypothetical protein